MIRPEIKAHLLRWREVIASVAALTIGGWLIWLGGWFLMPLGGAVAVFAIAWGLIALRRLHFLRGVAAPGMVEVDEGQIGYFGPSFGGFVALSDLAEVRLAVFYGARHWRLKTTAGEVLLVPVDAAGAEKLYDAFAVLPGIDMARLADAIDRGVETLPLWRRETAALARD